ncbi:MAG: hypothetical protein ABIJ12_08100 [bacterium]
MNRPLYHNKEIYRIFPPDWHKDTEYGLTEIVGGYTCLIKFDIDSDIVEFEKTHRPEIRVDIKVMDKNNSARFWFLKYTIKMTNWKNGLTQETKDDFMNKIKPFVKQNINDNSEIELPYTYEDYFDIVEKK